MITQWHGNVTGGCIYAIPASKDNNCPADDDWALATLFLSGVQCTCITWWLQLCQ